MFRNRVFVLLLISSLLLGLLLACSSAKENVKEGAKEKTEKIEVEPQEEATKRFRVIQTKTEQRIYPKDEKKFVVSVLLRDKADLLDSAKQVKEQFGDKLKDPGAVQVFFFTDEKIAKQYLDMSIEESMDYDKYIVGTYVYEKDKESTLYGSDYKVLKENF